MLTGGRVYTSQSGRGGPSAWRRRPDLEPARAQEPQLTSLGLKVARTITITLRESEPTGDGIRHYEIDINGDLAGSGMGEDLQDALLGAIEIAADQAKELPDN